jgi:hypothetical protein
MMMKKKNTVLRRHAFASFNSQPAKGLEKETKMTTTMMMYNNSGMMYNNSGMCVILTRFCSIP